MQTDYRNIYKTARESAGMTQEKAAEALGVCPESIRAYETGLRVPSNYLADMMVIAYNSQLLGLQHLRQSGDTGRGLLPEVEQMRLPEAVCKLLAATYRFADQHRDRELIDIARDGLIDETERPVFDDIVKDLGDIIQAALELRCAEGAERRS